MPVGGVHVIGGYKMGIFRMLMNVAKARMMGKVLRRGAGGSFGTALMLAYFGKKAYDMSRARGRRRIA